MGAVLNLRGWSCSHDVSICLYVRIANRTGSILVALVEDIAWDGSWRVPCYQLPVRDHVKVTAGHSDRMSSSFRTWPSLHFSTS